MLKHIPTGQPLSAGSRNQHNHQHHHNHLHNHNHENYNVNQTMSSTLHHQHYSSGSTTTNSARVPTRQCNDSSIYDSLVHPLTRVNGHQQMPSSFVHRHPLNHSQLSVNNLSSRFNNSHPLNLSTLSTSKHSIDSASPVVSNGNSIHHHHHQMFSQHHHHHNPSLNQNTSQMINEPTIHANGGLDISRLSRLPSCATPSPSAPLTTGSGTKVAPAPLHAPVSQQTQVATIAETMINNIAPVQEDISWSSFCLKGRINDNNENKSQETGIKEMLIFLGLLCLVSLLLAMLSHIFLLKISPMASVTTGNSLINPEEYTIVYEVTLALCALAMSLNLCCLLVCAIQFMFAMKLVKSSYNQNRTNMYLQKSSASRMCAIGGFFISIPIFLTGMILYTFIQFHSTPAIVMSVFIGLGIVFCGCAMVHNVFVWQREKTNAVRELARAQCEAAAQLQRQHQQQQPQQLSPSQQQQQQQQQQQLPQQQMTTSRNSSSTIPRGNNCRVKSASSTLPLNLRGSQYQLQTKNQLQYRNGQMSPILYLPTLSTSPVVCNHSNIDVHRIHTSPPTTPADDNSPTSPTNKSFNRSQHQLHREITGSVSPGLPAATLDLSSVATTDNSPHELSTLV